MRRQTFPPLITAPWRWTSRSTRGSGIRSLSCRLSAHTGRVQEISHGWKTLTICLSLYLNPSLNGKCLRLNYFHLQILDVIPL